MFAWIGDADGSDRENPRGIRSIQRRVRFAASRRFSSEERILYGRGQAKVGSRLASRRRRMISPRRQWRSRSGSRSGSRPRSLQTELRRKHSKAFSDLLGSRRSERPTLSPIAGIESDVRSSRHSIMARRSCASPTFAELDGTSSDSLHDEDSEHENGRIAEAEGCATFILDQA